MRSQRKSTQIVKLEFSCVVNKTGYEYSNRFQCRGLSSCTTRKQPSLPYVVARCGSCVFVANNFVAPFHNSHDGLRVNVL